MSRAKPQERIRRPWKTFCKNSLTNDWKVIIMYHALRRNGIAGLCKGSTADSDSVCEGSNPSPAARKMTTPLGVVIFCCIPAKVRLAIEGQCSEKRVWNKISLLPYTHRKNGFEKKRHKLEKRG